MNQGLDLELEKMEQETSRLSSRELMLPISSFKNAVHLVAHWAFCETAFFTDQTAFFTDQTAFFGFAYF